MQPDLVGLEISWGEIKRLTGMKSKQIYRPLRLKTFTREGVKTLIASGLVLLNYLILAIIFPSYRPLLAIIHGVVVLGLGVEDCYKIVWSLKHRNLIRIIDDVDRYNAILKAIDLNDELEAIGNTQVKLNQREQVITAMQLIREDLIRAMKTERILRKNRKFLAKHEDLFITNLTALTGLQISDRSSVQGRLLHEALQIATHVQAELKQLQDQHSPEDDGDNKSFSS